MQARNAWIYHCQRCGKIAYRETHEVAPLCCSRPMARAAGETIYEPRVPRYAGSERENEQSLSVSRGHESVTN